MSYYVARKVIDDALDKGPRTIEKLDGCDFQMPDFARRIRSNTDLRFRRIDTFSRVPYFKFSDEPRPGRGRCENFSSFFSYP